MSSNNLPNRWVSLAALAIAILGVAILLGGCDNLQQSSVKNQQTQAAKQAANEISFSNGNAEIENIKWKLKLTSNPDAIGFIVLMNDAGQPILYEGTWGTSGDYIFYRNAEGAYRQWSGQYLYSDQPIRLRIEPLVVGTIEKK